MKVMQLAALKNQHKSYIAADRPEQPDGDKFLITALVNGQPLKLKPVKAITMHAVEVIAQHSYNHARRLSFESVFEPTAEYVAAFAKWEKANIELGDRIAAYRRIADPLIRKAEFNTEANAEEIAAELQLTAIKFGLE